jgi:hypothetical protein
VLNEGASVAGRLLGSDGRPRAHHDVYLLAPASVDDADRSGLLFPGSESSDAALRRRVVAIATTDAEGAFQVSAPAERELLLHARHPGNVTVSSARFTLAPDEARTVGELVLPDGAHLAGRLVTDAGVSPAGLRLWVAPAGAHRLALGLPTYQACASGTTSAYGVRAQVELETVELDGSPADELELSLRGRLGRLTLAVLVDGVPAPHAEVQLQWRERNGSLEGRTGGDGRLGPLLLFPGTWSVTVRDPLGAWSWSSPVDLQVATVGLREETLAIEVTRGALRIVDAQGEPRRTTMIHVAREGGPSFLRAETDAEGRVELALGTGLYRLSLQPFQPGALLEWTPGGPAQTELGL